jgi:hypothetical protein
MIPKSSFPLTCATTAPIIGLLGLAQSLTGQILISRWDFNSGSLSPESGLGEALLVGGTSATFAAGYQGEPTGGWNIKGFPTQGTLPGTAGVQFNLSTEGFSSVGLSFQIRHSNTSANSERVLWSIEGQPFTEAGRFTITPASTGTGETWYQRSVDLPAAAAHQANLSVRIVSDFDLGTEGRYLASRLGSSYSTSGTWRFDNVNFSAVPEPEEYAALSALTFWDWGSGGGGLPQTEVRWLPEKRMGFGDLVLVVQQCRFPCGDVSQPNQLLGVEAHPRPSTPEKSAFHFHFHRFQRSRLGTPQFHPEA